MTVHIRIGREPVTHHARNGNPADRAKAQRIARRNEPTVMSAQDPSETHGVRPARAGKRWDEHQDARLCEFYGDYSTPLIAKLLARTHCGVATRLRRLGMKPTTTYGVSFRREWEECFQLQIEAHSMDEARTKAEAAVEHVSTDWNNMEETFCEPIFVDSVNAETGLTQCDALWERPLTDTERMEQSASLMLTMLRQNLCAWENEEDSVQEEHAELIASLRGLIHDISGVRHRSRARKAR